MGWYVAEDLQHGALFLQVIVVYPSYEHTHYEHKLCTSIQLLGTQHPDLIDMLPHYEIISPYARTFREARAC